MKTSFGVSLSLFLAGVMACEVQAWDTHAEAMNAGRQYLNARRLPEARAAFEAAAGLSEERSAHALARIHAGHTLYYGGRYAEARALYADVLAEPGLAGDALFFALQFTGHAHLQEGAYAEALAFYRQAGEAGRPMLARNAAHDIWFTCNEAAWSGVRHFRLGDLERAEEALHAALALEDLSPRQLGLAWLTLGQLHARRGELDAAVEAYERARTVKDRAYWQHSEALLGLARVYRENEESAHAHQALLDVLAMGNDAQPHHRLEAEALLRAAGREIPSFSRTYGAGINPTGSPIGGGEGYADIIRSGDYEVDTLDSMLDALGELAALDPAERAGRVVYLLPDADIDLGGAQAPRIRIPSGVTLAGNRGDDGAPGPLLYSDRTLPGGELIRLDEGARITGLRLRGDAVTFSQMFSMWPHEYFSGERYDAILADLGRGRSTTTAIRCGRDTRVDNCVIGQFSRGLAISVEGVRIQHNILHDIQPYPIVTGAGGFDPLIEANIIDWAWHAVATADHMTASYTMRYNIVRETSPNLFGQGVSGCFALDHHGQGTLFRIHHNTFEHMDPMESVPGRAAVLAPVWDSARVYNNWFADTMSAEEAVRWIHMRPAKTITDLGEIVTGASGWSQSMQEYLEAIEDFSSFDLRELVAMTRGGGGGENLWVFDNAYGPRREVLERTLTTPPRIFFEYPPHRRVRTDRPAGRGGATHPALPHLGGEVPVLVTVDAMPPFALTEVTIELVTGVHVSSDYRVRMGATRTLYEGAAAPAAGELVLDTSMLENGIHGLRVTAGDGRGIRARHQTFFEVLNPRPAAAGRTHPTGKLHHERCPELCRL